MIDNLRQIVPTRIRRSYAAKFAIVLLIIVLSVGVVGSAATVQITNEVQSSVDEEYSGIASQEAGTIEQWIERNSLTTRLTGQSSVLRGGQPEDVEAFLDSQMDQLPGDVYSLHVAETSSNEVVASTELTTGNNRAVDATEQPWWEGAREAGNGDDASEVIVTDAYTNDVGMPVVSFVTQVPDTNRVLATTVRTEPGASMNFQGSDRTDGGFTQVVDGDDRIIFDEYGQRTMSVYPENARRPLEAARALRTDSDRDAGVLTMNANPDVFYEGQDDGVKNDDYVVGYADIDGTDWVVVVHAPRSAAYGFVTTVSQFGLLATLTGLLLIAVPVVVIGRNTAAAIDRLTAKTQRMEEGDLSVDFETDRIDNIGRLYDAFASMRDALRDQIQEAQAARREAEEAREEAEMMTHHLVEKADSYSEVMEAVADGDMTRKMDPESRSDAMQRIAVEFNEMIEEIEATTQQVKDFATEVATSSEEVTASSEEVKSASEQVTESIQEITDGAERQNDQLQNVSNEMNSLSTTIEEIASSANEVADLSQQTAETGDDARENAEEAIEEMNEVEREHYETVAAMEELEAQMEEIEEITEFITDVAEQTNVLALNANIEAARAGEAGEGFAVVAEEVKSLAEETREAAEEIDGLVENLQEQTETTVEEVEETSEEVARSTEIVEETVDSLEEIAGYAKETNAGVQQISDATSDQASSTNQVVGMVDEAASIAEQTSNESENVAAAAEEQTTALTEVTNSASDLAEQASRLSSALERFETESGEGRPGEVDEDVHSGADDDAPADDARTAPDRADPGDEGVDADVTADAEESEPDIADALGVDLDADVTGDIEVGDIDGIVGDMAPDVEDDRTAGVGEAADAVDADDADAASPDGPGDLEASDELGTPDVVDELADPADVRTEAADDADADDPDAEAPDDGDAAGEADVEEDHEPVDQLEDGPGDRPDEDVDGELDDDADGELDDEADGEAEGEPSEEADGEPSDESGDEPADEPDGESGSEPEDGPDEDSGHDESDHDESGDRADDGNENTTDDAIDEWLDAQVEAVDEVPDVDDGSPDEAE